VIDEAPIGRVYDARLMKRLLRYLRPYRGWVAASICLLLLHSVLGISGPYLTKVAIDHSLNPQPGSASAVDPWLPADRWSSLQLIVLVYLGVQLASFVFRAAQIQVMNHTGQRVMFDLRHEIFRHLQAMGVRFYDRNPVGRLVTRVTTDVDMLNELFTSGVVAIAGDLITLLFILGVMLYLSPPLTLVLVAVAPLVVLATIWFRRRARQSYRDVRLAVAKINSFLQEHFSGMAVVQIFNYEGRSWDQFNEVNAEHRDAQYQAIRAHAYFLPLVEWFGVLGLALVLVYGGYLVSTTPTTIGVLVAFVMYGTRVFRPLQDLSDKYNILQSAMASSERVFALLDTPADEELADAAQRASAARPAESMPAESRPAESMPAVSTAAVSAAVSGNSVAAAALSPRVEFNNVWFAYQGEDWVLRGVSLTVEPGEMVAIVGHTGAGKTTLISLLLRFYGAQRGTILVGGRDVREWPLNELRRQFGVVLQDPYVFSGTIESNIRLRNPDVSGERLRQVIREVNLETFVSTLARGIEEPVLERGSSLSSGQKQLLSFARALAFNPRFLILDEATSSVDTDTEFKIREALSRMLTGHTSIVIAHRLSTIQRASRIVVMHKGQVRETGNHQELLAQRGIYYKLYQLQYRDQELAAGVEPERAIAVPPAGGPPEAAERAASPPPAAPEAPPDDVSKPEPRVSEAPPQHRVGVNGTEQSAAAEPASTPQPTAPQATPATREAEPAPLPAAAAKGGGKRRRRKKPTAAAENQPADGHPNGQLSLSLDTSDGRPAEAAPQSPASSPTLTAPESKPRRRRGKRKKKDAPR
jgi:ATP-binding cassette subfamily B protein